MSFLAILLVRHDVYGSSNIVDYGDIPFGATRDLALRATNNTDKAWPVKDVTTTCGCLVVTSYDNLVPAEGGHLSILLQVRNEAAVSPRDTAVLARGTQVVNAVLDNGKCLAWTVSGVLLPPPKVEPTLLLVSLGPGDSEFHATALVTTFSSSPQRVRLEENLLTSRWGRVEGHNVRCELLETERSTATFVVHISGFLPFSEEATQASVCLQQIPEGSVDLKGGPSAQIDVAVSRTDSLIIAPRRLVVLASRQGALAHVALGSWDRDRLALSWAASPADALVATINPSTGIIDVMIPWNPAQPRVQLAIQGKDIDTEDICARAEADIVVDYSASSNENDGR